MADYVLGTDPAEVTRLEHQAAGLDRPSRAVLAAAGLAPGMRVLDLGSGLGHVARIAADLVGAEGEVVGVDASPHLVGLATERSADRPNVRFVQGDVTTWRDDRPFDAVIGRLILFHLPDPVAVLRHHAAGVRPGGIVAALDFDMGGCRTEPASPLASQVLAWVIAAFRSGGANPVIGARLPVILAEAGLRDVANLGMQQLFGPDDRRGPASLAAVARSLAEGMVAAGIASREELGIDTLADRLAADFRARGSVLIPPLLIGAWGRVQ